MFKKLRGVQLPYVKQGYIYFLCQNYDAQTTETQVTIENLCNKIGGEYSRALYLVMTSRLSVQNIAIDNNVSERTLYELRRRFYMAWESESIKSGQNRIFV